MSEEHPSTEEGKNYEALKQEAEIRRLNAEVDKLEAETEEFKKPLFRRIQFLRMLIAGGIAGLAFITVLITVIEPAYKRDIILQEIEIAEKTRENYYLLDSISEAKEELKNAQSELELSITQIDMVMEV